MSYILFDVGAHHGENSLPLAENDPNVIVYAFEAVPEFVDLIKESCSQGLVWNHYECTRDPVPDYSDRYNIYHTAVSDYDGTSDFYIADGFLNGASSLYKFTDTVKETWPGREDLQVERLITVPVTRLDTWYKSNNIQLDKIDYFHCDAQGADLRVLVGMGDLVQLIREGVVECSCNERVSLYSENHTVQEMRDFLNDNGFEITQETPNDSYNNEYNIYFRKK
jgi:FkbM family methyltransferase